jgi:hypothetical protein
MNQWEETETCDPEHLTKKEREELFIFFLERAFDILDKFKFVDDHEKNQFVVGGENCRKAIVFDWEVDYQYVRLTTRIQNPCPGGIECNSNVEFHFNKGNFDLTKKILYMIKATKILEMA